MKPLNISQAALEDLEEAMQWYAKQDPDLPQRLLDDVNQTIQKLHERPELGIKFPRSTERFKRTKTFPYLIIYEDRPDEVYIRAIAHQRRKPGYWRKR